MSMKQGDISYSYDDLVSVFGKPFSIPGDDKVDVEWEGFGWQIYNWKNGPAHLGKSGTAVETITRWSVGGDSSYAMEYVSHMLRNKTPVTQPCA